MTTPEEQIQRMLNGVIQTTQKRIKRKIKWLVFLIILGSIGLFSLGFLLGRIT